MRAIGYFREASGGEQTLAQQNRAFLEYCKREGLEPDMTFADTSASNGHGSGFRELITYIRGAGSAYLVVVPGVDALGGDLAVAARRYFQLEGLGAQVRPMSGGADMAADIVAMWGAQDGNRVGERVRAAMRRKAVKGEVLGRPPYGYKVGSRRRLELIPEEAVVVRYIYRLYLNEGLGIRLIARRLNEEGLKTRRGGNWSMVSIRDILRNRVYLGTYSRFGVRVPGSHPPLVSADDFKVVQDRLNARRTSYNPRVTSQFLLSGIAQCGYCGNRLIGVSRKQSWTRKGGEQVQNSYRYYQCESRTNQSVCSYHTRRAADLEREVHRLLGAALADGDAFSEPQAGADAIAEYERERDKLRARMRSIDRRIERYVESAAKGRLARDNMRKLITSAAADRLAVEDALEVVERRIGDHAGDAERLAARERDAANLVDRWDALTFAERQSALRETLLRITVTDDAVELTLRS